MLKILKLKVEQSVFFSGAGAGGAEQASAAACKQRSTEAARHCAGARAVAPRRSERWGACGREAWRGVRATTSRWTERGGTGRGGGGAARGEGCAWADGGGWGTEKVRKER